MIRTTGLDAKTALNVMTTIHNIAQSGRTVVLTIHQPRSDIVHLFDDTLLLARGKVAYFGPTSEMLNYFAGLGYDAPPNYNPADFVIDLVAETAIDSTTADKTQYQADLQRIDHIVKVYDEQRAPLLQPPSLSAEMKQDFKMRKYQSSWVTQFAVVFWRSMVNIARDRLLFFARLFQTIIMAVLVGLIYLRLGYTQRNIQDRTGVLFFSMLNLTMGTIVCYCSDM